jgi:CBS domain-containing protein
MMPTVQDLMTKDVVTIDAEKTVFEAAKLMTEKEIGDLVVVEGKTPVGIVTERDFVRRVVAQRKPLDCVVSEIMTTPLWVVYVDTPLKEAARKMVARNIRRLPVLNKKELVGIITASDFTRYLGKKTRTEEIREALGQYSAPEFFDKPENPRNLQTSNSK